MIKKENVKTNFLYQSAYQILTMLLPMVTSPYIARVLGADGIGIYSYTYSIVSYFVLGAKLGLDNYGNRYIATVRDDQEKLNHAFSDLYALHVVITLIVIGLYCGFVFKYGAAYKVIFAIQGFWLIGQLLDINWLFFGIEKFKITVTRNTIVKMLTVVFIFVFVKTRNDTWKYILILAAGSAISESLVWLFLKQYVKIVKPNWRSYRIHLRPMLVLFIPSIAVSLYKIMDKIMLGSMTTTFEVGLYENSEKIINICLGFVTALGTVMLPRMSNMVATGQIEESKKLVKKSSLFILILSYAMGFGIIGVSGVFPSVFWGKEFVLCGTLMIGLAISLPFTAIANVVRTQILIPQHKDNKYVLAVCMGALVNAVVNYVCIPRFNALGAVIGTICAEGVVCIIQLVAVQNDVPIWNYIIMSVPFALIGGLMAGMVMLIGNSLEMSFFTLCVQILTGGILFCGICFVHIAIWHKEILHILKYNLMKTIIKYK